MATLVHVFGDREGVRLSRDDDGTIWIRSAGTSISLELTEEQRAELADLLTAEVPA